MLGWCLCNSAKEEMILEVDFADRRREREEKEK